MTLQTEVIDLEAEQDRLRDQMEDVAEKQVEWSHKEDRAQQLLVRGNELNNQRNVLGLLREGWGVDSVTLSGLSAGDVNRVEDTVEKHDAVRERDAWVALGTHDAPYVEHDPDNVVTEAYEETVANVTDLPLAYVRWAEQKISELSHLSEDMGNGYLRLVRDKQAATSDSENG